MNKRSALGDKALERYKALSKEIKRKEKTREMRNACGVKSGDIVSLNITLENVCIGDIRRQNETRGRIYRYRNGRTG